MSKTNDGGPAFPGTHDGSVVWCGPGGSALNDVRQDEPICWPGMTLRDWFAGQALVGLAHDDDKCADPRDWRWAELAVAAYRAADAMLAERAKERA